MPIQFKMLEDGGFVAGDSETRITCYAYPTSDHAEAAKREPRIIAAEMIESENAGHRAWMPREDYDARNWERIGTPTPAKTPGQLA